MNEMSSQSQLFFERVWDVVRCIPEGKVTSYGAIARFLGAARSARMVGYAMNASHKHDPSIPAHRVVNRLGLLSGKNHFSNPQRMQHLLEKEGVLIKDDKVQEFEKLFWDPLTELESF